MRESPRPCDRPRLVPKQRMFLWHVGAPTSLRGRRQVGPRHGQRCGGADGWPHVRGGGGVPSTGHDLDLPLTQEPHGPSEDLYRWLNPARPWDHDDSGSLQVPHTLANGHGFGCGYEFGFVCCRDVFVVSDELSAALALVLW
jgi:hypothetical protein